MNKNDKGRKVKNNWFTVDKIDPNLTENQIGDIVNRKLAYIIMECEYNPLKKISNSKKLKAD